MEVLSHILMEQKAHQSHLVCSAFSMLTPIPRALTVSRSQPRLPLRGAKLPRFPTGGHKQGLGVKPLDAKAPSFLTARGWVGSS